VAQIFILGRLEDVLSYPQDVFHTSMVGAMRLMIW